MAETPTLDASGLFRSLRKEYPEGMGGIDGGVAVNGTLDDGAGGRYTPWGGGE